MRFASLSQDGLPLADHVLSRTNGMRWTLVAKKV
jgi:hypothetical protein